MFRKLRGFVAVGINLFVNTPERSGPDCTLVQQPYGDAPCFIGCFTLEEVQYGEHLQAANEKLTY